MTEKKAKPVTLEEAIKSGAVILKADVDRLVKEEFEKGKGELKRELQKELAKEHANALATGSDRSIKAYLDKSGLGDKQFAKRLMAYNITPDLASNLRDEHMRLSKVQLWDYIRSNSSLKKTR